MSARRTEERGRCPVGGFRVHRRPHATALPPSIVSTIPARGERDAIDAQRAEGHVASEDAITHLSPAHFEAINSDGTLAFDSASVLKRSGTLRRS